MLLSFSILFFLFIPAADSSIEQKWLNSEIYNCANFRHVSLREAMHSSYKCIYKITLPCISDTVKSNTGTIYHSYFCGFIHGTNFVNIPTIWTIKANPAILIRFFKFSLEHTNWKCMLEKLEISIDNSNKDVFCGGRFPWIYHRVIDKKKLLTMHYTSNKITTTTKFLLQYYSYARSYIKHKVLYIDSSISVGTYFKDTVQFSSIHMHLIAVNKIHYVRIHVGNFTLNQITCHDGPGVKSPAINTTADNELASSFYQMVCLIEIHNQQETERINDIKFSSHIAQIPECDGVTRDPDFRPYYLEGGITHNIARVDIFTSKVEQRQCIYNSSKVPESDHIDFTLFDFFYVTFMMFDVVAPNMLVEDEACAYGGIHLLGFSSDVKTTELWSYCSRYLGLLGRKVFKAQDIVLLIQTFRGYTDQTIEFMGILTLENGKVTTFPPHSHPDNLDNPHNPDNPNNPDNQDGKSELLLTYPGHAFSYFIQPPHIQLNNRHSYVIHLDSRYGWNIFITFNILEYQILISNCVSCTIHSARVTRYFQQTTNTITMRPNRDENNPTVGASITKITLSHSCPFPPSWSLSLRTFVHSTHLDLQANSSMIVEQPGKHFTIVISIDTTRYANTKFWFAFHIDSSPDLVRNSIWRIRPEIPYPHEVNEVYIEQLKGNASSNVYRWNYRQKRGANIYNNYIWIEGCYSCNILIVGTSHDSFSFFAGHIKIWNDKRPVKSLNATRRIYRYHGMR